MNNSRPAPDSSAPDGTLLPVATARETATRLWLLLRGRRLRLAGVLLLFIAEAATTLVFPLVVGRIIDALTTSATADRLPATFWWLVGLLAVAAVTSGVLTAVAGVALARIIETVIARLREDYVAAALALPRQTIESAGIGDVVTRASDDIAEISNNLPNALPALCGSVFTLAAVAVGLGGLDGRFLIGFAVIVPLYALMVRWYLRIAPPVYTAERAAQSRRGQQVLGTLTNLPTVTAHRWERRQLDEIGRATWATVRWAMRARIVQNRLFSRVNLTQAIGLGLVLAIGISLALAGEVTAGAVAAATLLFQRTVAPLEQLMFVMDDLQSALASLVRVVGVARTPPTQPPASTIVRDPNAGLDPRSNGTAVALKDLHFSYQADAPVLRGISAAVRHGEVLAIVGATGAGKSTLASVVAGVHEPTGGDLARSVPEERIATITQETHVFAGSVRENLTLARPDATDAELLTAVEQVGAGELIAALPDGLDTEIGARGHQITPAQAQHLALVRLMLANPELVVLDEATAESDTADTGLLDRAASAAIAGRTALVIAHRLSQAAAADRVMVLDSGRVVEIGTHDELLSRGAAYARLWAAWTAGQSTP